MKEAYEKVEKAAAYLRGRCPQWPSISVTLGSGFAELANSIEIETRIPFEEIPGMARASVAGHVSEIVVGKFGARRIVCLRGRLHRYEGHEWDAVVFPFRAMALAGTKTFVLTNAAGGCDATMAPADLVLLNDHINFFGSNPLFGPNDDRFGPRFADMTEPYSKKLRTVFLAAAKEVGVPLREGVYLGVSGPSFETAAEIRAFQRWGADVVGMSTVPETIALRHMGRDVVAVSCVSNLATGLSGVPHDHASVLAVTRKATDGFGRILKAALAKLGDAVA